MKPMVEPVVDGVKLSRGQRERLADADRLTKGGLSERQRAAAIVREVERELEAAREADQVDAGIADTLTRAKERGETFEVEEVVVGAWRRSESGGLARRDGQPILDTETVRRASKVDGLANLYRAGAISDRTKMDGDRFRVLWEKAKPPMSGSAYDKQPGGGGCDTGRMLVQVAEAGTAAAIVGEIQRRLDARAFDVMVAVAGRGQSIRSLGSGGDFKTANQARLVGALGAFSAMLSEKVWNDRWKGLARKDR